MSKTSMLNDSWIACRANSVGVAIVLMLAVEQHIP